MNKLCHTAELLHYNDVIMGAMASQITSLTIVYSTVYSGVDKKKTSKLRVTCLCAGNSSATCEFPAQRASNAENVSIWWCHHGWFEIPWCPCDICSIACSGLHKKKLITDPLWGEPLVTEGPSQRISYALFPSLWGESTGHRWIPLTKASKAELWCLFWSAPVQRLGQTIKTPVIWEAITPIVTLLWWAEQATIYHWNRY